MTEPSFEELAAIDRLLRIAKGDTGQSHKVADFLLAWHNAQTNGGWDPTDLWTLDGPIVHDVVNILNLIARKHAYPSDIGFKREIEHVWQLWRGPKQEQQQEAG